MSLRRRMIVGSAAAAAVAVVLAAAITYFVARGELHDQVDDSLREAAGELAADRVLFVEGPAPARARADDEREPRHVPFEGAVPNPPGQVLPTLDARQRLVLALPPLGGGVRYAQIVRSDGEVVRPPRTRVDLPGAARARELARRGSGSSFADGVVDGTPVRVYTRATGEGAALQVARPVDEVDDALTRLAYVLGAVGLGGIGLAAGLALIVARAALRPVTRLSAAAEHVARTRDLSRRMEREGSDELANLAGSFNTMLEALERSMRQQRRLVADASHELRTPLTSLRTNIEVLAGARAMPAADRERLLGDVVAQLEELTVLVGDLMDLARDEDELPEPRTDVRLDLLVEEAVGRARRRHPDRPFALELDGPALVHGVAPRIDRAVANLIDNAEKWSPPGQPIEVTVRGGEVVVRDHGPGIAAEDLPYVFDRFYRAPSARGTPGSGLGLAIVRHVAETHGGGVVAEEAPGGGARLVLRLPATEAAAGWRSPPSPLSAAT